MTIPAERVRIAMLTVGDSRIELLEAAEIRVLPSVAEILGLTYDHIGPMCRSAWDCAAIPAP